MAAPEGTRPPRPAGTAWGQLGDSLGTALGPPAQHRAQGSVGWEDRPAVGDQPLICSQPEAVGWQKNPHFPFPSSCCKQPSSTASPAWHQLGVLGVLRGAQLLPAVSPGMIWAPREAEGVLAPCRVPLTLELACCCLEAGIWCSEAIISWGVCCLGRETQHVKICH